MLSPKFLVQSLNISKLNNSTRLFSLFPLKKVANEIKPINYHISTAKKNDINATLNFIEDNYFREEPLSKSLNITQKSLKGPLEIFIKDSITQGMTVIAKGNSSNEIIGVSLNIRCCRFDVGKYADLAKCTTSINTKKLFHIWSMLARESRPHDRTNQMCLFEIKMLAVKKECQRQKLGSELVQKSLELARDLNFMYAVISCTNSYARQIIHKQNMKSLMDVNFSNILLNDAKTPVSTPEHPHSTASVYFMDLKTNLSDNK